MTIMLKIAIGLLLILVLFNLFKAMVTMLKQDQSSKPMSFYIGRRLIFTVILMLLLLIALATGVIQPNPRPY